ncbi:MAG: C10 family peptidase [Treponema sp.]|nr:C10 family peptidase [Treponema sp.]
MKKNAFWVIVSFAILFAGCSQVFNEKKANQPPLSTLQDRKDTLATIAYTGKYISSEEEMLSALKVFLSEDDGNSMRGAIIDDEFELVEIYKETFAVDVNTTENRAASISIYDTIPFYLFSITNKKSEIQKYAITSTDMRIGNIIAVFDNEFEYDISNSPFMQMIAEEILNYAQDTADIWNSLTSADIDRTQHRTAYEQYAMSSWAFSFEKFNSGNISNIMKTNWEQDGVYSDAIKAIKNNNTYVTGCTATAVAQLMAFHEYPSSCNSTRYSALINNWAPAKNWSGNYDWEKMKKYSNIRYDADETSRMMVGALMYDVAEGIISTYEPNETSSNLTNAINYLRSINFSTLSLFDYSYDLFKSSIDNGSPVLVGGQAKRITHTQEKRFLWWKWTTTTYSYENGHAWIADGYCDLAVKMTNDAGATEMLTANFIHCNPGWGSYDTGYFLESIFNFQRPLLATDKVDSKRSASSEGTSYYYKYLLQMIPYIKPNGR